MPTDERVRNRAEFLFGRHVDETCQAGVYSCLPIRQLQTISVQNVPPSSALEEFLARQAGTLRVLHLDDVSSPSFIVSKRGARFRVSRRCRSLSQATSAGRAIYCGTRRRSKRLLNVNFEIVWPCERDREREEKRLARQYGKHLSLQEWDENLFATGIFALRQVTIRHSSVPNLDQLMRLESLRYVRIMVRMDGIRPDEVQTLLAWTRKRPEVFIDIVKEKDKLHNCW
jgi:hypothetical protein